MKSIEPRISMYCFGSFLNNNAIQNPIIEFINVIIPIRTEGNNISLYVNFNDIPAPSASILVATASPNMHKTERQSSFNESSLLKALFKNLIAKYINIINTIHLENIFK